MIVIVYFSCRCVVSLVFLLYIYFSYIKIIKKQTCSPSEKRKINIVGVIFIKVKHKTRSCVCILYHRVLIVFFKR